MSEPWDFDATLDRAAAQFADHFACADGESAAVHERAYEYAKTEIARAVAEHDRQVAERAWDHCLDEIEKYEINTQQARERSPYRAAKGERK